MKLNIGKLKKYARLYFAKKALDRKSKYLNKILEKMEPMLIDHINEYEANSGIDMKTLPLKNSGGLTFKRNTMIWAKLPQGRPAAIKVLKATGHEDQVAENFDSGSLSALLRELDKAGEIPREFKGIIDKNPKTSLTPKKL
jgi:hypothetical protein